MILISIKSSIIRVEKISQIYYFKFKLPSANSVEKLTIIKLII